MIMKMKKLFILIAVVSLMAACSEDVTTRRSDGDGQNVTFSVIDGDAISVETQNSSTRINIAPWTTENNAQTINEKVVKVETDLPISEQLCITITEEPITSPIQTNVYTRGSLLNSGDASALVFGVTEFVKDDVTTPFLSNIVPIYQNTTLDDGSELFRANETWEHDAYDGTEYDFYAYAPKVDGTEHGMTLSNNNTTITYNATGVDVGDQPDLMTARKATSAYVSAVPLTFQHRLCAIQIKTSGTWAAGFRVSAVKFTNVISSGTFNIDTDKDDAWSSYGSAGDYVLSGFNEADATGISVTGPDDKWLMMVPQTLSNAPSSKLSITLTDASSNSYIVTAPISATTWTAGQKVTYNIAPESFATMTVNYPSWNDGGNAVAGPVSTYETADQFGLFVLNKDGKILISNQLVTPTTGDAATSRTLDIPATIFTSKQYKYFLMYPYRSDLETLVGTTNYDSYYKKDATGRTTDADAFFTDVISNWAPAGDQSTAAVFKNQDLQIASLSGNNFYMVHKMGLVKITLGTKSVPTTRTYSSDAASGPDPITNMKYTDSDGTQTVTASSQFDDSSKPLNSSGYFYIVNGSKTLKSVSTVNTDWERELTGIVAGSYNTITIENTDIKRTCYKFTALFPYTGAVQEFPLPVKGTMTMQCWGASGATMPGATTGSGIKASVPTDRYSGGKGGYVSGVISSLGHYTTLYVYVGQTGVIGYTASFSFNGGGYNPEATATSNIHAKSQGGGATDIRLAKHTYGTWGGRINTVSPPEIETDASMSSRLIVAGGGAGAAQYCFYSSTTDDANNHGGDAGGLTGYSGNIAGTSSTYTSISRSTGGTQSSGGYSVYYYGGFGYGGSGYGGGGGGYYGGGSGGSGNSVISSGGGGSSYVSGHGGCTSLSYGGTTYTFSSPAIYDGLGYLWNNTTATATRGFPTTSGSGTENGHSGNGYAKITMTTPYND